VKRVLSDGDVDRSAEEFLKVLDEPTREPR
jgi:hypothetical protein